MDFSKVSDFFTTVVTYRKPETDREWQICYDAHMVDVEIEDFDIEDFKNIAAVVGHVKITIYNRTPLAAFYNLKTYLQEKFLKGENDVH